MASAAIKSALPSTLASDAYSSCLAASMPALASAFNQAHAAFGPVDICIAGAAGNFVAEAANMSSNGFRTVVDIDLVGTWNTFRAVLALLREGRSNLLAISAVQSVMPMATQAHVCAAKAGIDMLVRTLSIEWAQRGVRCNAIAPGPVADTEGMRRLAPEGDTSWARVLAGIPMARAADADEIADLALFLCSGAARYIHGTVIERLDDPQDSSDDGPVEDAEDDEAVAGPIAIAVDVNEPEAGGSDNSTP